MVSEYAGCQFDYFKKLEIKIQPIFIVIMANKLDVFSVNTIFSDNIVLHLLLDMMENAISYG